MRASNTHSDSAWVIEQSQRTWMDGTQHLELSPIEWLEKLAALVPPQRVSQILYHGVLAPHAKWRKEIGYCLQDSDHDSIRTPLP